MADGKKGGAFATQAFPGGSAPIVRLVGPSQVKAMSDLAGRLAALAAKWRPSAPAPARAPRPVTSPPRRPTLTSEPRNASLAAQ